MPISKELVIQMENRPGMLAQCCKALTENNVNILGFLSVPEQGKSTVRMVVDNLAGAKKSLDGRNLSYTENEVAQVMLPNRPGELSRAASQLADANINIEHSYAGVDQTSSPVVFFGVKDVNKAVAILDKVAKAA
jgi:hypothetical protein